MTRPVVPQQRIEGDTAQARADRTMADLKAGLRVVQSSRAVEVDDDGEPDQQD